MRNPAMMLAVLRKLAALPSGRGYSRHRDTFHQMENLVEARLLRAEKRRGRIVAFVVTDSGYSVADAVKHPDRGEVATQMFVDGINDGDGYNVVVRYVIEYGLHGIG